MSAIPIVALDYPSAETALAMVDRLGALCRFYKVGSELFTAAGPALVRALRERGAEVFLDLKFHDIPNTVRGGVRSAAALGARLVTVHASGGEAMLGAAAEGAGDDCAVLAVTVLTSIDAPALAAAWGRPSVRLEEEVLRLAGLAAGAGLHGVVCSGAELPLLRARFADRLAPLVPGIRLAGGDRQDQVRVVTPGAAVAAGARYLVLGRTITTAPDPVAAMRQALDEMRGATPAEQSRG